MISRDIYEQVVKPSTGSSAKKSSQIKNVISREAYEGATKSYYAYKEREAENYLSRVSKADNWMPQSWIDNYINETQTRAKNDTANADFYNSVLSTLKQRKEAYGQFETADAYNNAVKKYNIQQEFGPLTFDEKEKLLEEKRKWSDEENRADKIDYLENYALAVGYSHSSEYQKEIDSLNASIEQINRHVEFLAKNVIPDSAPGLTDEQIKAENAKNSQEIARARSNAQRLKLQVRELERKMNELKGEELSKETVSDLQARDDFEEKANLNSQAQDPWYFRMFGVNEDDRALLNMLEEDEKKALYYLGNTEGERSARGFFEELRPTLNKRAHKYDQDMASAFAESTPIISNIVSVGTNLVSGFQAPIKFVLAGTDNYEKNWASLDQMSTYTSKIRETTLENIDSGVGKFVYSLTMSTVDMVAAWAIAKGVGKAFGTAGASAETIQKAASGTMNGIMASESASSAMTEAHERGLEWYQIAAIGFGAAAAEVLSEKYAADSLFDESTKGLKRWVITSLSESGSEVSSNVLNTLWDGLVAGDEALITKRIQELMDTGLTRQQAAQQAFNEKAQELGNDALAGLFMGAFVGGIDLMIDKATTVRYSVPDKFSNDLGSAQTWVAEKLLNQKAVVKVKGLGNITIDRNAMNEAVSSAKTKDRALMFLALNSTLRKGAVATSESSPNNANSASIIAPVYLNGNMHMAEVKVAKVTDGQYTVNGITLDGNTIYDASTYAKPVQDTAAANGEAAQDAPQMQSAENGSLKRRADDEEHIYTAEDDVPTELDTAFANMSEERRAELISTIEKNTGVKIVFDETLDAKGKYKSGVITINPTVATPMTVLKHELTHYLETVGLYGDLMNFAFEKSETFKAWMQGKGFDDIDAFARKVVDDRADTNHPLGQDGRNAMYEAKQEILADFVGEKLFRDVNALAELAQKKRPLFERIVQWFKNLFNRNRGTAMEKDLRRMEKLFEQAVGQRRMLQNSLDEKAKFSFGVTQVDINEYVERAYAKENDEDYKKYATVSERLISDTQDQIDLSPYSHALRDNDIRHINNSHGEGNPNEKYPVTKEDIKRIPDIVSNYDKVFVFQKSPTKKGIMYVKVAENGLIYYLEQATEKYGNEPLLVNKQMIKTGLKDIPDLRGLKEAIEKKQEIAEFLTDLEKAHQVYAQSVYQQSLSDPIKPQNGNGVNPYSTQETEKYSPFLTAERRNTARQSAEQPSGNVDLSSFSTEELRAELAARNPKEGIADIARLQPQDATTTPNLRDSGVRNRKGDGNSAFAESIQATDIFDDQLKELAATDDVISRYDTIANTETMEAANKALNEGGNSYVFAWQRKESKSFTAEDVAAGFILLSRYQKIGDYQNAVIVAQKLREVGTVAGQTVQIFSILSRLTPEGMMAYAQHELDLAWKQMIVGKTRKWVEANQWRAQLTAEDCEYIVRRTLQAAALPEGRDKNIRLAEISARVQSKIPQQKGQAFKAWQRTAMLLNPKTQLRNVLGNATMMPQYIVSDLIGTVIDKGISKATGKRTTSGVHLSGKAFKQGLFESWDDFVRHINTRGINQDRFEISGQSLDNFNEHHDGRISRALNPMSRALNALDRFNSFLLDAGDRSFYQMWFINSLNGQMKANHATEPTAEMIEVATQDALQRTWQDVNTMTKAVGWIKEAMNTIRIRGYGLGDVVIKFVKTPANITKAIFDFSPAGFVKALAIDARKFKIAVENGQATAQMQRNFVKNLSNGITGTLMMFIASAIAKAGLITGKKDEDKDVADFERYVLGKQPYSVKIGNTYFSYDWAQPTAAMFAIAADYFSDKKNAELTGEEKGMFQTILDAIKVGGQVLYNQSFMTSIQNLFSDDGPISGFVNTLLQDPSAMVPQLLSQIAASADPSVRNSYENGNDWKTAINKVLYKLPGARNTLAESVDALGNTKKQYGNDIQRTIASFFSVANIQQGYESKAGEEIYRLYQSTGSAAGIPSAAPNSVQYKDKDDNIVKITLSSHDKEAYTKVSGKTVESAVEKLVGIETYDGLSDENKAKLMSELYSYSKQKANNEVLGIDLNDDAAKAESFISQGIPVEQYFLVRAIKNSDESDLDGSGGIGQDEAQAILDSTTLTKKQKEILWTSFNSKWKSNPYKYRYY